MIAQIRYVHARRAAKIYLQIQTHYVQPDFSSDLTFFAADFKEMLKIGSLITLFQVELNCLNNFT